MKLRNGEKKTIMEATTLEQANVLCRAGVDGIQFDKLTVEDLTAAVKQLRNEFPGVVLLAAGGINETNITAYASNKVDGIVKPVCRVPNPLMLELRSVNSIISR